MTNDHFFQYIISNDLSRTKSETVCGCLTENWYIFVIIKYNAIRYWKKRQSSGSVYNGRLIGCVRREFNIARSTKKSVPCQN